MTPNSKLVIALIRYFIIATGAVVYRVRNSDGKEYIVTLHADGTTACLNAETEEPCEASQHGKICYHKLQCIEIEAKRAAHIAEHGSIAGFVFAAPVKEKKERKARSYTFEIPTMVEEMVKLREVCDRTTSKAKREALCQLFASMADENGVIAIADRQWCYDADINSIFEVIQIVPQMLPECPVNEVYRVGEDIDVSDFANEPEEEQEFSEEVAPALPMQAIAEPTKAQVIMSVRQCAMDLVSVCDGARDEDSVGCNGVDAKFMHRMMGYELWRPEQILKVAEKLQKYNRSQLGGRVPSVSTVQQALGIVSDAPLNNRNQGFRYLA